MAEDCGTCPSHSSQGQTKVYLFKAEKLHRGPRHTESQNGHLFLHPKPLSFCSPNANGSNVVSWDAVKPLMDSSRSTEQQNLLRGRKKSLLSYSSSQCCCPEGFLDSRTHLSQYLCKRHHVFIVAHPVTPC